MLSETAQFPNEFEKYWHPEKREWHQNIKGVYHISSIGCSHQDLKWDEHYGPCLRSTYWDYTDPIEDDDETKGNKEMGREVHERLQKIIKEWKPNCVIEKPLAKVFERDGRKILLVGSIDVEYHHLFNLKKDDGSTKKNMSIWDIKTASIFTMPVGKFQKNPTYFDQTKLYATFDITFDLNPEYNMIVRLKIIYVKKHNKETKVQRTKYDLDEGMKKLADCIDRAFYLDECLEKEEVPVAEPQNWCKLCKYLDRCKKCGDVEEIMKGKKVKKMVGLKVKKNG